MKKANTDAFIYTPGLRIIALVYCETHITSDLILDFL